VTMMTVTTMTMTTTQIKKDEQCEESGSEFPVFECF
jgi:hypothetical protein